MCESQAAASVVCLLLSMSPASVNAGCGHVSCVVHIKPVSLQYKHAVCVCEIFAHWCWSVSALGYLKRFD